MDYELLAETRIEELQDTIEAIKKYCEIYLANIDEINRLTERDACRDILKILGDIS